MWQELLKIRFKQYASQMRTEEKFDDLSGLYSFLSLTLSLSQTFSRLTLKLSQQQTQNGIK